MKHILILALAALISSTNLHACACGCSIFDVGTSYNFPDGPGGMAWLEYDFQTQSHNWSGWGPSPSGNNDDKLIRTNWVSAGFQYFPSRKWGVDIVVPSANRLYKSASEDGPPGSTVTHQWWALGDIRVNVNYTGFSEDMSTGINLGIKIPSGKWDQPGVDRDNQIGTGSTDILFGGYHEGKFGPLSAWEWFVQAQVDAPVIPQDNYLPGIELDTALGVAYRGFSYAGVKVRPLFQALFSYRSQDSGSAANFGNTGFERLMLSPGIEFDHHPWRVYTDVEFPVAQYMNGNQLASVCLVKVTASIMF